VAIVAAETLFAFAQKKNDPEMRWLEWRQEQRLGLPSGSYRGL